MGTSPVRPFQMWITHLWGVLDAHSLVKVKRQIFLQGPWRRFKGVFIWWNKIPFTFNEPHRVSFDGYYFNKKSRESCICARSLVTWGKIGGPSSCAGLDKGRDPDQLFRKFNVPRVQHKHLKKKGYKGYKQCNSRSPQCNFGLAFRCHLLKRYIIYIVKNDTTFFHIGHWNHLQWDNHGTGSDSF